MLSRSKRIFGVAALALVAATTAPAAPAFAERSALSLNDIPLLRELQGPICLPNAQTGLTVLDALLPQLMACPEGWLAD
ncbi:hypothetical protein AB0C27_35650 [Nonomuraea sp. NPDC048882]|uniref:hypothetical protein n=1 Tax=unclassified Nonomuraea TaxID=2593643 RepID=UPI0033D5C799